MDAAYQDNIYVSDRTIDSHIRNIRRKFENIDQSSDIILTVHGLGYKLKA
jgi:two-component system response regulator ChvI